MVIELTLKNSWGIVRKTEIPVKEFTLTELIENNEKLIKLIKEVITPNEVLTGIRDLDIWDTIQQY